MQFSIGIRVVGFVSLILGVILLSVCGWTLHKFVTGEIGKNGTLTSVAQTQHNGGKGKDKTPQPITDEYQKISDTYTLLKKQWKEFKPFLMGSGGLAIAGGVVQVITSLVLLCSGPKGARNRTGCFKMTHFIVALGLVVALVVPAAFDVSHESWSQKLRILFSDMKRELHTMVFEEGFNPDVVTAYYSVIAVDITGIFALIFCTCCLMRNAEYDYREYP